MAKRLKTRQDVAAETARKIAQGRCQGVGQRYVPWTLAREFASRGQVARILGRKTNRLHHLFSLLEQHIFFYFEWLDAVTEIREQFALPLAETLAIAARHGIPHPRVCGEPVPLTTDFLVTVRRRDGSSILLARAVKYLKDLDPATKGSARTRQKLELERLYWASRGIDWGLITEVDVPKVVVENVRWVRPYQYLPAWTKLSADQLRDVALTLTERALATTDSLIACAERCDTALGLAEGDALAIARYLIGTGQWTVDMRAPIRPRERLALLSARLDPTLLAREAA